MNKTLIIAGAFEPELLPLKKTLGTNADISFLETGIGLAAAAAKTASFISALQHLHPESHSRHLVFVGSLGANDTRIPLLSIVHAEKALLSDTAVSLDLAYLPEQTATSLQSSSRLFNPASMPASHYFEPVYSPLAITFSQKAAAAQLSVSRCRFESLELFGVACACSQTNSTWESLQVVTNYCTENAKEQWRNAYEKAATITAETLLERLK